MQQMTTQMVGSLLSIWEIWKGSGFLASAWPSPAACRYLEHEAERGWKIYLTLSLSLVSQHFKYIGMIFFSKNKNKKNPTQTKSYI